MREQFLVEITGEPDVVGRHHVTDLAELNRLFAAWVETCYHRTVHSETGRTPLARWSAADPVPLPAPEALTEAFLWEEHRRVTKTATVSLHGNSYEVDPALVGRKVVIVANLAPRKLRGIESQGMIVAASRDGDIPVLASFLEDVPVGARLK